ncbi:MAG: hypothetical protein ACPHRO_02355 [Nannocystaceae bacterium]
MHRTRSPLGLLTATVFIAGLTGCSSPWPPEGGERPGAHPERIPSPIPDDGPETLLHYARKHAVDLEGRVLELPGVSQAICAHALKAVADDDMETLLAITTDTAFFGLTPNAVRPALQRDARRFEPLAVHDHPELFMERLRTTGSTMSTQNADGTTRIACGRELPAVQDYVTRGAESMWCSYADPSSAAWINFSLLVTSEGPRINYVGTTPETPRPFVNFSSWPPPSTTVPALKMPTPARTTRR